MEYILTPYAKPLTNLAWWDDGFSDGELNWLQNKAKEAQLDASVGGGGGGSIDKSIRRSKVNWINNNTDTLWLFARLGSIISRVNADYFNFDLIGFGEGLQLTNYESNILGEYNWHTDSGGPGPCRKLSLSMQLSFPEEYEGGVLEVKDTNEQVREAPKKRGYISLFPSFLRHRVTPVTKGSRQSLVVWITGPNFK